MTQTTVLPHTQSIQLAQGQDHIQNLRNAHVTPPAALGRRHSSGHTVARVALAIITLGITEIVHAIKSSLVNRAAARARLPENQPPVAPRPSIATLNLAKANSLDTMMNLVNPGKARALAILGTLGTLDNAAFTTDLQWAIEFCPTEVTDAKLDELSEQVARSILTNSIIRTIVNNDPLTQNFSDANKLTMASRALQSPPLIALRDADTPESVTQCHATCVRMFTEQAISQKAYTEGTEELLAKGMKTFAQMTGLSMGAFTLVTLPLHDKLKRVYAACHERASEEKNTYAWPSAQTLMDALQPVVNAFFVNRANEYNSITTLDIPESLKQDFQGTCLSSQETISPETFTNSTKIAAKMASNTSLNALLDQNLPIQDRIDVVTRFAVDVTLAFVEVIAKETVENLSPGESALISSASYKIILDQQPALLGQLIQSPELLTSLTEALQNSTASFLDTINAHSACQFMLLAVNDARPNA